MGLVGFLLAVTMNMDTERFDHPPRTRSRRGERHRDDVPPRRLPPGPPRPDVQQLLKAYVPLRVNSSNADVSEANLARSAQIADEVWKAAEGVANDRPDSEVVALFVESANEMIEARNERVAAAEGRVPSTVVALVLVASALMMVMVGYNTSLAGHRSIIASVIVGVTIVAVLILIVDLDRPRDGLLRPSQRPLSDLELRIGPPSG